MDKHNSKDELRGSLLEQLRVLKETNCPPELAADLVTPWHTSKYKEILLILECLALYDVNKIRPEDFVELISLVTIFLPSDADQEVLYRSILNTQSALLVKWPHVSPNSKYILYS